MKKGVKKICSRGHEFYKSSDCPVCPKCWPGYKKKLQSDFPAALASPALRALNEAKIKKLADVANFSESELLALHGMGAKGIGILKDALNEIGLSFKE